mmetsp:Transcript_2709/g.9324  ORF Transcript_2709/g.9324 Transcript_2709/m.9324 type:complete len:318 (-) Transcript_2709:2879-3832(-)
MGSYSPKSCGTGSLSKTISSSSSRSILRSTPLVLWLPLQPHKHPFSTVASSNASQIPITEGGSVYKKVESWCGTTSPPILGCLKMYMDCTGVGSRYPSESSRAFILSDLENFLKAGSRSCRAWPILLIDTSFWRCRLPSTSNAPSSKKKDTFDALSKKYCLESTLALPFMVFSCFFVEKMEMVSGSNERTSSSPLSLSSRTSAAVAKSSSTRNPSASYAAFWPSLSSALGARQGRLLPQVPGLPVRPAASLPPHNALVLILHQLRYQPPSSCVAELPDGNPPRAGSQDLQVGVLEPREQGHVGPSRRAPFPPSAASG